MARLDELQSEIDSLKYLLKGKVISTETEQKQVKNFGKKASFSVDSASKANDYPTTCEELLFEIGDAPVTKSVKNGISGIHLLRGTDVNTGVADKIKAVYCDFTGYPTDQPTESRTTMLMNLD